MTNPAALSLEQPLEIDEARRAARVLAQQRRDAEDAHARLTDEAATAEQAYRKALAVKIVNAPDGMTAAQKEAWAKGEVADLSYTRDLKAGMVKVAVERLRGLEGERSMLKTLMEWSARELDRQAPDGQIIGRRVA